MEILEEAPNVIEYVEEKLFTAINEHVKGRVTSINGWTGCYELYTDEKDQTIFAPDDWPTDDAGWLFTYFTLYHVEMGDDYEWLSNVIGLKNAALCLQFIVKREYTGLNTKEYKKRLHDFYSSTSSLAEAGFLIAKNGVIYRPFSLDVEKVADEFPEFDEALAPLDAAMNDVFRVAGEFDIFVKSLK
ncbi:hypothetical protein LJC09_03580 [Desulfovibrio sp. OttesenSCG-928-F20]|nr:hypothetical protein [Desulfovibrio sp. OttesenSCG-928-F20]